MKIKHVELFSGIGGFRKAFDLFGSDHGVDVKCIAFSENDINAVKSYEANYNIFDEIKIGNIDDFVQSESLLNKLPNFNFLTGGFPCQSFSMMGKQKGFSDHRGNHFFNILKR